MGEVAGLPVEGYKPTQSTDAVAKVSGFKRTEERILRELDDMLKRNDLYDPRWVAIGRTAIEQGFMAVNRAVFKPGRVTLAEDGQ